MGQGYTIVNFEIDFSVLSPEVFDKIDLCFEKIRYRGVENSLTLLVAGEFKRGMALAARKKLASSIDYITWYYDVFEDTGPPRAEKQSKERKPYTAIEFVCSRNAGQTDFQMFLKAPLEYRPAFTRSEIALAKKIERISLCLHESLGAKRTSGRPSLEEKEWFYFSKDQSKIMGELPHWEGEDEEE